MMQALTCVNLRSLMHKGGCGRWARANREAGHASRWGWQCGVRPDRQVSYICSCVELSSSCTL